MATMPELPNRDARSDSDSGRGNEDQPTTGAGPLLFRRYRVIRELGRGGMGVVMLAQDTALDIPVAVKLVPDLVVKDTEAIADLRKEVLRGMALAHPGIVRTHNFDRDEGGAGIVMEFVDGDTLTELKQRQPGGCFDAENLLPLLDQLCSVLDYAHRDAHIVHRDLKPRNIMVTKTGRVKVADFGIAAVLSDSASRHSMEGHVSGTLSYMSPQQVEGKRPSHLDDIHALGATLYELLTGKPPFFRGNQAAIFQQVLAVVPPSLAARRAELEVVGKTPISRRWEEVIAACLAKDPALRPQTVAEVRDKLAAEFLSRGSVGNAGQISPALQLSPGAHPSRSLMLWSGVGAFGVVLAGAAFYFGAQLYQGNQPTPVPRIASATPSPTPVAVSSPSPLPTRAPSTPRPTTPVPTPTPVATPPPPPPRARSAYHGSISEEGSRSSSVPLSIRFDSDLASGTLTEGSSIGDTVVAFSGTWTGDTFQGHTGEVITKPARVKWDPESFELTFTRDGASAQYTCKANGKIYRAEIKNP